MPSTYTWSYRLHSSPALATCHRNSLEGWLRINYKKSTITIKVLWKKPSQQSVSSEETLRCSRCNQPGHTSVTNIVLAFVMKIPPQ